MDIVRVPHRGLAKTCEPVTGKDLKAGTHAALLEAMRGAMKANNGIGLAANQVGEDLALFVIDAGLAADNGVPDAFANPEITDAAKEEDDMEEGCLSIPGYWVIVPRSKKIMFKALDENGNKVKFRARGMLARVLQHETDHLNGLTIRNRAGKGGDTSR
ncbi:MAG TPA: peptide deformylase [Candidatus Paceibacterota bacterium]|nr:peptide deformylase [Candidatus Paceibacterota bacterium]